MNTVDTANTSTARKTARAPRKTVAQKRAEQQAASDKQDQDFKLEFCNTYSARLLKLLHAVLTENAYGGVAAWLNQDAQSAKFFSASFGEYPNDEHFTFPADLVSVDRSIYELRELDAAMSEAEFSLQKLNEARIEEMIEAEKKKAALSKLTDEERELLGL
jgi:hypothetical protein